MKKTIYSIFFWIFLSVKFFDGNNCFATHFIGSEISYQCTGTPGIYNVSLKVFKDCSGVQLCPNCPTSLSSGCNISINIAGASGTCNGTGFGSVSLTVDIAKSGFDVVQLCKSSTSICSNCGTRTAGSITPGIEVYVFSGLVNLTGIPASCCLVSINFGSCCRNSTITTLSNPGSLNYYTEAIINRCASPCNSSPVYNIPPDFVLKAGADANLNMGASDPDGDSLSYALAPSLTGAGTAAPYASPYSPLVPFAYLGAPVQSPPALPPVGINMNPTTGDLRFRPQGNFVANIVIEVSQWKNIAGIPTLMGKNRRDHQFNSLIYTSNATASLKKYDTLGTYLGIAPVTESIAICAGQKICRNYVAATNNLIDTTDLEWSNPLSMPGATLTRLYNDTFRITTGPRMDSMRFCWTVPSTAASNTPYVAVFLAKSRLCTFPHKSLGTLAIYASAAGAPLAFINKALTATNKYKFTYTRYNLSIPDKLLTQWKIETFPGSNIYTTYNSDTISPVLFTQNGKYRVKLVLTSVCNSTTTITDSVYITSLFISPTTKNIVCKGDSSGMVTLTPTNAIGPVLYNINNGIYQSNNIFTNLAAGNYFIKAQDSLNFRDSINITIAQPDSFVRLNVNAFNNVICRSDSSGSVSFVVNNGRSPYLFKSGTGTYQSSASFNKNVAGNYTFYVKDSNNCTASAQVNFTQPDSFVTISVTSLSNLRCMGDSSGSATLFIRNGKAPYQYRMNSLPYQSSNVINKIAAGTQTFYVNDSNNCNASVNATFTEPATGILLTTTSITNVICKNDSTGIVTLSASNGLAPYQYKLLGSNYQNSNIITRLKAGIQTLMVLDSAGCPASIVVNILEPLIAMSLQSTSITHVNCNGDSTGAVSLSVRAGQAPFRYKIAAPVYQSSNTFNNLKAGSITCYALDSNNCAASKAITITEPLKIIPSIQLTQVPCHGGNGSIAITANGGVSPYLYQLDSGGFGSGNIFNNIPARQYFISAKDQNNCVVKVNTTLVDPQIVSINSQVINPKCFGQNTGSIQLNVSGGRPPYQYKFGLAAYSTNNLLGNLTAGTYNVSVKDSSNCLQQSSIIINQAPAFSKTLSATNAICSGLNNGTASIQLSGGTPPYAYSWKTTPVQTTAKAINMYSGYAYVTFTDSNLCTGKDSVMVGLNPMFNNEKLCVVSNDTSTSKNIISWDKTSGVGIAAYKVYASTNAGGPFVLVASRPFNALSVVLDNISGIPSQAYYYNIKSVDSCNVESSASAMHKTIYLNAGKIAGNDVALNWNSYSGIATLSSLSIKRSINGGAYISLASVPLTTISYIDSTHTSGIKRYIIDLTLPNSCATFANHVYSNMAMIGLTGISVNSTISYGINVYPNPTEGLVKIQSTQPDLLLHSVEVYNLPGSKVKELQIADIVETTIDLGDLANGMYNLVVTANQGKKYVFKVVLNR
ncbi:MAG: T9SS type A sorting domain-containing protein [Bacteroidia bacterium]|nr:T9SS type A sorting domain-containing protein [Bacteroidia bacterium]